MAQFDTGFWILHKDYKVEGMFNSDEYLELQDQVEIRLNEFLSKIEDTYHYFKVAIPWQRPAVSRALFKVLVPYEMNELLEKEYAQLSVQKEEQSEVPEVSVFIDQQLQKSEGLRENESDNSYPSKRKEVLEHIKSSGRKNASQHFGIPNYLIESWVKEDKKGVEPRGRRPNDHSMESSLCKWITDQLQNGEPVSQRQIRQKARAMSSSQEFKGSKGWLEKFFRRHPAIFLEFSKAKKKRD